ncbi:MAG TPA: StlD/DarB family beta-ketosynthase [Thermomicrobiales bacterium]|nr:StlD/DarB family beta-ketosynthase [Thermomicrobiales bacterium]
MTAGPRRTLILTWSAMGGAMQRAAYVTGLGVCLPNSPVANDEVEQVLGRLSTQSAAVKRRALMNNGIKSRHYAIDPDTGNMTHSNVEMTAEAIRAACNGSGASLAEIECLVCGTSSPDQLIPSHASMVHAALDCPPCEVVSTSGVCCSGVSAFKYGYLNVAGGLCDRAVVTGSDLASPIMRASHFEPQLQADPKASEKPRILDFGNEFLRWMLSDGAGALVIADRESRNGPSLRIDWVDLVSFANRSEVCMYLGMRKIEAGAPETYRTVDDGTELLAGGFMSLAQDVGILADLLPKLMKSAIRQTFGKHNMAPDAVDWLLPHYSSEWFRQPLYDGLVDLDLEIPFDRWFTNLSSKGNTGAASIYIMLEELVASGKAKTGHRILCMVPESARMTFGFIYLTVV